MYSKIVIEGPM